MQERIQGGASGAAPRAAGPKGGEMNIWNKKNNRIFCTQQIFSYNYKYK